MHVCFLYENEEAITEFSNHIHSVSLSGRIDILKRNAINEKDFDFIVSIDTPEVFNDFKKNLIIECHSTYPESIQYLNHIDNKIKKILTPSLPFKNFLLNKFGLPSESVDVLQNFVPKTSRPKRIEEKTWNKNIVFYFGRLDSLKNPTELIKTFQHCKTINKDLLFLIASPNIFDYSNFLLKNNDLIDSLIIKNGLGFSETTNFLYSMLQNRGIYISASSNESFGLATAESLSSGIPSVVRNIPAHHYLCQGYEGFLFCEKNGSKEAAEKICKIAEDYETYSLKAKEISDHFICNMQDEHINQLQKIFNL